MLNKCSREQELTSVAVESAVRDSGNDCRRRRIVDRSTTRAAPTRRELSMQAKTRQRTRQSNPTDCPAQMLRLVTSRKAEATHGERASGDGEQRCVLHVYASSTSVCQVVLFNNQIRKKLVRGKTLNLQPVMLPRPGFTNGSSSVLIQTAPPCPVPLCD